MAGYKDRININFRLKKKEFSYFNGFSSGVCYHGGGKDVGSRVVRFD